MKLEREGKLEEYLEKEPNFLHSLLSDHRVTDEQVSVIILDLIGAGIDSVSVKGQELPIAIVFVSIK